MAKDPTLEDLLRSCERSAVHLELRDGYMRDEPIFQAWLAGERPNPADRDSWWDDWWQLTADTAARGVDLRRARIVSEPISDYVRCEYDWTFANVAAGEQVRWLPRRQASDLALPGNDFLAVRPADRHGQPLRRQRRRGRLGSDRRPGTCQALSHGLRSCLGPGDPTRRLRSSLTARTRPREAPCLPDHPAFNRPNRPSAAASVRSALKRVSRRGASGSWPAGIRRRSARSSTERPTPPCRTSAPGASTAAHPTRSANSSHRCGGEEVSVGGERHRPHEIAAPIHSKGSDTEWIHRGSDTPHLPPRLLRGREAGPVFLSDRRPGPTRCPGAADLCLPPATPGSATTAPGFSSADTRLEPPLTPSLRRHPPR